MSVRASDEPAAEFALAVKLVAAVWPSAPAVALADDGAGASLPQPPVRPFPLPDRPWGMDKLTQW